MRRVLSSRVLFVVVALTIESLAYGQSGEIVLYPSEAATVRGNWAGSASAGAANGRSIVSADLGWSSTNAPLASPANYFEMTFDAAAGTSYRIWMRLRAAGNSKWNDAVWVQFSDSVAGGSALYRIGSTSGLLVNLERCAGCGTSGWGWQNTAYWLSQTTAVSFATSGRHTIRVQIREDGVEVDQIVLSPAKYMSSAPGPIINDTTILPKTTTPPPSGGSTPYGGSPAAIPGTIEATRFDEGGANVAYVDTDSANQGGEFRSTGVDIQASSGGGYNVGWINPGEWLAYTVNVAASGTYSAQFKVASVSAGSFQVSFGSPSNVSATVSVPNTGAWQAWTTVSVPVTLAAGQQVMTVRFSTAGMNLRSATLASSASPPPGGGSTPYSGSPAPIPGQFQAVHFDHGGANVAYADADKGNNGGALRNTDVDIEPSTGGGYNVGWTMPGEWLAYSVNVARSGSYTAQFRVASTSGGNFQVWFGSATTPAATAYVPVTATWQSWTTINVPLNISAGSQVMTLRFVTGGVNLQSIAFAEVTTPAGTGTTIAVNAGMDLQSAINGAKPGDTILLQAGATFVGNFVLPAKSATSTSYVTIRSSAPDSSLPGSTTRITPAYAGLLPKLRSGNAAPALATEAGAHHYRLQFIEFTANQYGLGEIVQLGDGTSKQNTLGVVPHHLVLDRVYIHGDPTIGQKRGVSLNTASTNIINSHISDMKMVGTDTQAIAGWNGPGPFLIENNYLEASAENVLFGGADPKIPNLVPSDITLRRNRFSKPLAWRTQNWQIKNLLELKNAQRVKIDGNIFEHNWQAAQSGYAILFTPVNQDGTAPWSVVQDIEFTNNIVRDVAAAISIGRGSSDVKDVSNVTIRNNLFDRISKSTYGGSGYLLLIVGGSDVEVNHNTINSDGGSVVAADYRPTYGFVFTNNVLIDRAWAIKGSGAAAGNDTISKFFPGGQFFGGIYIGSNPVYYPTGNFYPATVDAVGFVNFAAGDYRLSSSSIYRGGATDGKDPGTDFAALNAAQ